MIIIIPVGPRNIECPDKFPLLIFYPESKLGIHIDAERADSLFMYPPGSLFNFNGQRRSTFDIFQNDNSVLVAQ